MLHSLPGELSFHDRETVQAMLQEDGTREEVFVGKSYVFPPTIGPHDYPDAVRLGEHHRALTDVYDARIALSPWGRLRDHLGWPHRLDLGVILGERDGGRGMGANAAGVVGPTLAR